jgi:hypothetical protein
MSKEQGGQYICQKEGTILFIRIVPCCPHCVPAFSSLATFTVLISLDHQFVLPACLTLWDHTAFGRRSVRLFQKFSFRLGVLKLVSASVTLRRDVLRVLSGLMCFDVLLLRFCQGQQPLIWSLL